MIKPICERGKVCLYLKKEIRKYEYPLHARSQFMVKGKELCYFCNNPKRFDKYRLPKLLTHEEKFRKCGFKVTDKLEVFL